MNFPHILGGSNTARSPLVSTERTVNFYPVVTDSPGATSHTVLNPTPGLGEFGAFGENGTGIFEYKGRLFVAGTESLIEFDSSGGLPISSDTMDLDLTVTTFAGNAAGELFIAHADKGYVFDTNTNTLTEVRSTDTDMCVGVNQYVLVLDGDTGVLAVSELNDATTFNAAQEYQRSLAPDPWVGIALLGNDIFLFGDSTSEVWYPTGEEPLRFAPRTDAGVIPYGIAAKHTAKAVGGTLIWLARSKDGIGPVVQAVGMGTPKIITNQALDDAIRRYVAANGVTNLSATVAWTYEMDGQAFYVLNFVSGSGTMTWTYNLATNLWHENATLSGGISSTYSAWFPRHHAFAFNKHLVVGGGSGVFEMSSTGTRDHIGTSILRSRTTPVLANENKRIFFDRLTLHLETGLTGGATPTVTLEYSDNYGHTWTTLPTRSAGAAGAYTARVIWEKLGQSRHRAFRFYVQSDTAWHIVDGFLEAHGTGSGR